MKSAKLLVIAIILVVLATAARGQTADPDLLAAINKIKAIDNHSHPPKLVAPGEKDDDFDALPCDPLEPSDPTTIGRPENPQFLAAWKALYGYRYNDMNAEQVRELLEKKKEVRPREGDNFPNWVLYQLGRETEFANRINLGLRMIPPTVRKVAF